MGLSHSPKIITNGLVLCLDAGNRKSYSGSGTTWTDLSGLSNSGTLTNGPTFDTANTGNILFDGIDDYISVLHSTTTNISGSITLECWIKFNQFVGTDNQLIGKYSNAGGTSNQSWILFRSTANYVSSGPGNTGPDINQFSWLASSNGSFTGALIGTGETVSLNTWYCVTAIFTSSNDSMQLYVNGTLKRSVTRTGQTSGVLSTNLRNINIGGNIFDNSRYGNCNISNVKIYNRALSAAEVQQNFNALRGRFGI